VTVCDREGRYPLYLAAKQSTDTASIELLALESPGELYYALEYALKHNNKSTAVVSLLRKCFDAWEHGNISAVIDLCGESDELMWYKGYMKEHPVHFAVVSATDIAIIIKPVLRAHAPELLIKDEDGETPLDCAKLNSHPAVLPFLTEVDTAFRAGNYPSLIKLCSAAPCLPQQSLLR